MKKRYRDKKRSDERILRGLCSKCGKEPIAHGRSKWCCDGCLSKQLEIKNNRNKVKRAEVGFTNGF